MIYALNWTFIVRALAFILFVLTCLLLLVLGEDSVAAVWEARYIVPTVITVFLVSLNIPVIFGIVHKLTYAKHWLFPNLNGDWDAVITTNWPRILKTYESAKNGGPAFDAITDKLTVTEEKNRISRATVTIKSSLFSFSIVLRPVGSLRESRTRFVRPLKINDRMSELSYVFEQDDPDSVETTDIKQHFGAGVVRYDPDTDEIRGNYWSDRREDAGLNTAGTIRMTRKHSVS